MKYIITVEGKKVDVTQSKKEATNKALGYRKLGVYASIFKECDYNNYMK